MKRAALVALTLTVLATLALATALAMLASQRDEPAAPDLRPTTPTPRPPGEIGQLLRLHPDAGEEAPPAEPVPTPSTCPEERLRATDLGDLDSKASSLVHRAMNKTVALDERTVMAAIALSAATGIALDLEDITNYTIELLEVCEFSVLTSGAGANPALLVNSSLRRVIVFETYIQHNASLDFDTALRAIALHGSGAPVDPYDVLTFSHEQRTQRKFDQVVDWDVDVLGLALMSIQRATPRPETEVAPPEEGRLLDALLPRDPVGP